MTQLMKSGLLVLTLLCLASNSSAETNSDRKQFDNFNRTGLYPFEICTTNDPNYVAVVSKRVKTVWKASSYDGRRETQGAEFCANLPVHADARLAFKFMLPTIGLGDHGKIRYPSGQTAGIAQIFCHAPGECNDGAFWVVLVTVEDNELWVEYRGSCGDAQRDKKRIVSRITRNEMHKVIILIDPSNNGTGSIKVKYDGETAVNEKGIDLGTSNDHFWNEYDNLRAGAYLRAKLGQYAFDVDNYKNAEVRTVYYDGVTWMYQN